MQYVRHPPAGDFALIRNRQEQLGFRDAPMQIGTLEPTSD
jgi:hypothetical protein